MNLLLAGSTGFIGKPLADALSQKGYQVIILTRRQPNSSETPGKIRYLFWHPPEDGPWQEQIGTTDGIINLAGEPIAGKRWSKNQKLKILESRCDATQALARAIQKARKKPSFLINASAVGFYGPHQDEILTEKNGFGNDFLAQTCKAWEAHAIRAEDFGVRVVRLRIGIVLEKEGGALKKMIPPFRFFLGGPLGNGGQWMSWIHRADLINLILFVIEHPEIKGPLNATAPNPVTMKEFAAALGKVMKRPSGFPVPAFMLKLLLGEMADMLLTGQRVLPQKALSSGFPFRYPHLHDALVNCHID